MVIVHKKPPFKKVPILLFQFPSSLTWNNWLSQLLNLYYFVIYIYFSSNHFFCVPFFFFFHKATWSRRMAASYPFQRPYWSISVAVSIYFSGHFDWNWLYRPESDRFYHFHLNQAELKKKGRIGALDVASRRVRCKCGDLRTSPMLSW